MLSASHMQGRATHTCGHLSVGFDSTEGVIKNTVIYLHQPKKIIESERTSTNIYDHLRKSIQWIMKLKEGRRPKATDPPLL